MNATESFLKDCLDSGVSALSGHCQGCGDEVRLLINEVESKIAVDSVADDGAGLRYYTYFNKPEFLCGSCVDSGVKLGSPTEVYTRVVGYLSPVRRWNRGKKAEYGMRETFNLD